MAYQNVGQCKFFVDHGLWLNSLGLFSPPDVISSMMGLNPTNIIEPTGGFSMYYYVPRYAPINYVAFLGHNGGTMYPEWQDEDGGGISTQITSHINGQDWAGSSPVEYSGFSIFFITDTIEPELLAYIKQDEGTTIGSISVGSTYDMPHSPDLSLTMTREYGGIKTIETKGGASLSNAFYTKPPKWGDLEAWQLGGQDFSVGGRRIWSLNFSFLSDSSVFPDNPTEIADAGGWEVDETTPDFMSEVLKKTRGSMLPFIFQPNTDDDIFAICKFDQNSFKFDQVANGVYNVKLKIREVW
tara:strand:- start:40 stop:933 length:894 start_codon:yes stop_codon:yes gene_type:complete